MTADDCVPPLDTMSDGMLKSRMEELEYNIHLDETHLAFLKSEYSRYWTEKAKRQANPKRVCPSCGSDKLQPSALFDEGGSIDCYICKCGSVVPL